MTRPTPRPPNPDQADMAVLANPRACRDSKAKALEGIITRHQAALIKHARRKIFDRYDADDIAEEVVQGVFAELLIKTKKARKYSPLFALRTWLYILTTNAIINYFRRNFKGQASDEAQEQLADGGPEADSNLIEEEEKQKIQDAIATLPKDQAQVFTARFLKGRDVEAIARQKQVSPEKVYGLLREALEHLNTIGLIDLRERVRRTIQHQLEPALKKRWVPDSWGPPLSRLYTSVRRDPAHVQMAWHHLLTIHKKVNANHYTCSSEVAADLHALANDTCDP